MRRVIALIVLAAIAATAAVALHSTAAASNVRRGAQPIRVDGLMLPSKVKGNYVALAQNGAFVPHFWAGVNLGSTTPGTLPGQVAATRANYDDWLAGMGDAHISVVRIYTILRPSFYDALAAYDSAHPASPIYFIQGVWIPEVPFDKTGNAWDPAVTNGFKQEIHNAVDVVHGHADLPLIPGHAGGRYRSDVSRWLLAWSPGIEWDPNLTRITLKKNAGRPRYVGRYITTTAKANAMESWLAMELDWLASLEAREGWSRPLTFTNWLTADPLHHPYEPLPREDMVSIDATHIGATKSWPGGFFASYHAYPYYPDFLRRTPQYAHYRRPWDGKVDPYAGYLHALKAYHGKQALMITEFGVPSSLGIAHWGPAGRNQGDLSEIDQAKLDAQMFEDQRREGLAGGVMFEWIEEWFKFTWNTVDYQLPAVRRELWHDPMTNEQYFGIIAADPGKTPAVTLDGKDDEWTKNGSQVIAESRGPVREVRAVKDEEYLYLRLRLDQKNSWQKTPITVGFNVQPGGNKGLPGLHGFDPKAEVAITIGPGDRAHIKQAAWIDPVLFQYSVAYPFIKFPKKGLHPNSGVWIDPSQILNRPLTVQITHKHYGVELHSYANLGWGSEADDERNLVDGKDDVVEMRIPYAMLGYSDPSSNQVLVPHFNGTLSSKTVGRVGIALAEGQQRLATSGYAWDQWQSVQWHERRKAGWPIFAAEFARANGATVG